MLLLLGIVGCIFVFNTYKEYIQIHKNIYKYSLEQMQQLSNLTNDYYKNNQLNTTQKNLMHSSEINVEIKKLDSLNSDKVEKDALEYLKNHKDKEYYLSCITNNRFVFIKPIHSDKFIKITKNTARIENELFNDYWNKVLMMYGAAIAGVILLYFIVRKDFHKNQNESNLRQDEIKQYSQSINSLKEQIDFITYNDVLTRLPNRNTLLQDIRNIDLYKAIALINIDNFKEINDFYGLEIGDDILISFAELLKGYQDDYNFKLYRLHADEYALLWKEDDKKVIEQRVENLLYNIKNFSVITEDDCSVEVEATFGIALGEKDILTHADMVLKRAKKEQVSYMFYHDNMKISYEYRYNIEWSKKIRQAIKNDKIIAYAQPIANLSDKSIDKYEILVRMIDGKEIIGPFAFLEVAKKNKLYRYITRRVIALAFKKFANTNHKFSINLSILDMASSVTASYILNRIKRFPNPENITFEILESEGIENFDIVISFIQKVKEYGCKIAIDDFGTGYSNFEYILNLKIDLLKIDASLIKHIDVDKNSQVVVKTISNFAKELGIKTCAEYVHSEEVYNKLKEFGVDYVQGYYLSEPFSLNKIK